MKRLIQIISLLFIICVIVFMWMSSGKQTPEMQDGSQYSSISKEQIEPVNNEVQAEETIKESSQSVEKTMAMDVKAAPEPPTPSQTETKTEVETEEDEGIKIVMISVYEPETDVIPLPPSPSYDLSEVKGFHLLGNWNETPLNLVVSSNYAGGYKKIHYLDWDGKNPNEFKLYESLGKEAVVRVYQNNVQVGQFALASSSDEEFITLDLDLDNNTGFAYTQ